MKVNYPLLFICCLVLSACSVGPDYRRPPVCAPTKYKEAKGKQVIGASKKWKIAEPRDAIDRGRWWEIFKDPTLNSLEAQLNIDNQNIIVAAQNYRQACELANEARASYFPTLVGSYVLTRQKGSSSSTSFVSTSSTGAVSTGSAATGSVLPTKIFTTHQYLLTATWEPDLWGMVRRNVESLQAAAESNAALLASTRLSSQGSLAQFYFELRSVDMDQKILDDTVIEYKKALQITRNRYAQGVAGRADVVQAQSQLESAEALAINNGINRATYEHAIAVLIGVPPGNFCLPFNPLRSPPPPIPLEIPSCLLERRPDIAQAERLMAQANAQIGLAIAAYYPTFTLSAVASVFARSFVFGIPALAWSYGPQLTETIYDAGLRAATVRAAQAGYCSKVASYRQTVLAAFQDVEDNLASLRILSKQYVAENQAYASAKHALRIVMNEYKAGTAAYSDVIVAQNAAFTAQKNAADVNGLRMTAAVGLVKALGGGWDACVLECA